MSTNNNMRAVAALAALAGFALTGAAEAHTFGVHEAGFSHGFTHPLGGLDHLLAMVTVGLWAAQRGGRAIWLVPVSFMGMMVFGGFLGLSGVGLPLVELAIAASLMVLGSLLALSFQPPVWVGMVIVGAFAVFHGHAHGAEMPEAASPWLYALGFVAATGLLHAVGVGLSVASSRNGAWAGATTVRATGAAVAASGVVLAVL